ncbi:hypothetical protein AX15_005437 [Amanita polypyramis BW_CC]|nr:hypothetical protein AX15_005437 [Amanita polypyramis BW_CC]
MPQPAALILQERTDPAGTIFFTDVQNRLSVSCRCTSDDEKGLTWSVFDQTGVVGLAFVPIYMLEFGPDKSLGVVRFGPKESMPMKKYLARTSILASSRTRKFISRDKKEYSWHHRGSDEYEWICLDSYGDMVAYYRHGSTNPSGIKLPNILLLEEKAKSIGCGE